jgi:hypothetical protein
MIRLTKGRIPQMKNEITGITKLTREHIETAKGRHGELDLIDAVLPMIATIEGKDFFFFYEKDNPKQCFCVECPTGTFSTWQNQMSSAKEIIEVQND